LNNMFKQFQPADIAALQQSRAGETRLGQMLQFLNPLLPLADALISAQSRGARFALVGIPEDIGPRANFGQGGADLGFQAFLSRFINLQANQHLPCDEIVLVGTVDCSDLQQQSRDLLAHNDADLEHLRQLCAAIDQRVCAVIKPIFDAGIIPIVIGGGHNNSYPLLQALSLSSGQAVDAINLDPHADFRLLEGRHSGNGFSYAKAAGYLRKYIVLGLHELKNSAMSLTQMAQQDVSFYSYQDIFVRRRFSFSEACAQARDQLGQHSVVPLGLEVDTDSISQMPVSALTNCGISVADAEHFVWKLAEQDRVRYLHLAEAAPCQHPAGLATGLSEAGQVLSALVVAFIQARSAHLNTQ
jgi:formiminoglutamase